MGAACCQPNNGSGYYLNGVGRLKRGVSIDPARANLLSIHKALKNEVTPPVLGPLRDRYLGDFRTVRMSFWPSALSY